MVGTGYWQGLNVPELWSAITSSITHASTKSSSSSSEMEAGRGKMYVGLRGGRVWRGKTNNIGAMLH
jgi:hypothetical protein